MFIIDFDDTLFDTFRWKQARFLPLERLGIPRELIQETYRQIRARTDIGYTNERHALALADYGYDIPAILHAFDETTTVRALRQFVFSDAVPFLTDLRGRGERLALLSIGDSLFQQLKVKGCGLERYFQEVSFIQKEKERVVREFSSLNETSEPLWFINNRVAETQAVLAKVPTVRAVLKTSPDEPVAGYAASGLPYFNTLTEIGEYVRRESGR
ncbi:MAG: HAD family hydrolase [Candidatus Magasanikbacteria bacterium]|nr:HAD family hydrolase [Candidatus Magasanikbacteria bacterium]